MLDKYVIKVQKHLHGLGSFVKVRTSKETQQGRLVQPDNLRRNTMRGLLKMIKNFEFQQQLLVKSYGWKLTQR
ncbi:hypothetical protein [uncultured Deefgea sp.]|uniref:hypothetical protein n=1 Tax=uncultured Deefgea sp. TaxID=1304914 RepID=UPI002598516E|nr:hypothetical protein [uncultured Deefgea sp.]